MDLQLISFVMLIKQEAIKPRWLYSVSTLCVYVCVSAQSLNREQLFCDSMDCSLPGSSVHGILQTRILEWVAISSSRRSS